MSRFFRQLIVIVGLLTAGLSTGPLSPAQADDPAPVVTHFPIARAAQSRYITLGPDGNLWFTEGDGNRIGRLTPTGQLKEFPLPTQRAYPDRIIAGLDGHVWFVERGARRVGRITPTGTLTEFPLDPRFTLSGALAFGPGGTLWVGSEGVIWSVTLDGTATRVAVTVGGVVTAMATDHAGTLWMISRIQQLDIPYIGQLTADGKQTWNPLPLVHAEIPAMVAAPDGALWFTVTNQQAVVRFMPGETIETFFLDSYPADLIAAADGTFWMTGSYHVLWQLTPAGQVRRLEMPIGGSFLAGLAQTPDGAIWFPEPEDDQIGRLAPSPFPPDIPRQFGPIYFLATHHVLHSEFREYWETHGGLALQGYPLTDAFTEVSALDSKPYTVQYFERAVFELHPENQPPYDVLLAQLGTYRYQQLYPQGAPGQQRNPNNPHDFVQTGHAVGGSFRSYWEEHGGLAQFGYPLSDEFTEVSALDGKPYTVQYFERAVFEYHPENQPPYNVLLSQLGTYRLHQVYPEGPPDP